MRRAPILASAAVLALSIVSFVFVILALTSPKWSKRDYYYSDGGVTALNSTQQPLCSASRSPFYRCSYPEVPPQLDNATATCIPPVCAWYKPYGFDATSCRTNREMDLSITDTESSKGLFGTVQECQQVHYAGNLQIAAAFFIGFGLFVSILMTMTVFQSSRTSNREDNHESEIQHDPNHESKGASAVHSRPVSRRKASFASVSYLVLIMSACLYTGAVMQILAQFFGVLGLVLTASPSVASATGFSDYDNFIATDWTIDQGISEFATTAWAAALASAFLATGAFRRSRA